MDTHGPVPDEHACNIVLRCPNASTVLAKVRAKAVRLRLVHSAARTLGAIREANRARLHDAVVRLATLRGVHRHLVGGHQVDALDDIYELVSGKRENGDVWPCAYRFRRQTASWGLWSRMRARLNSRRASGSHRRPRDYRSRTSL